MNAPDKVSPDKVSKAFLRNFRGWAGEHELTLGADLVLLAAPNGKGKSSLVEALGRALGGFGLHADDAVQTLGTEDPWRVEVKWETEGEKEGKLAVGPDAPVRKLDEDAHPGPETVRRATCFTQDPLDEQFEWDGAGEDTLLGFLAPFPSWLDAYDAELQETIRNLRKVQPQGLDDSYVLPARRRRDDTARQLLAVLASVLGQEADEDPANPVEALLGLASGLPGAPSAGAAFDSGAARGILGAIEGALRETARSDARIEALVQRQNEVQKELEELNEAWPPGPTEELASWATGPVDLDRILDLLTGLAGRPERWTDPRSLAGPFARLPAESQRLVPSLDELRREVVDELRRVDAARAERARRAVQGWIDHWNGITRRRSELEDELRRITAELDRLTNDLAAHEMITLARCLVARQAELEEREAGLREDAERRARWPAIEARLAVLVRQRSMVARLREGRLLDIVPRQVQATMNAVMSHFVVAGLDGGSAIAVERREKAMIPDFTDGRRLGQHLSTGQKAQDALAWLLGTNALLQKWLPHRLLLLDDLSTALDLTNLAAECALLRKFAYASPGHGRKRQVILASHHDQLTHRIYDLLLPPGGFTMREIDLVGWSKQAGPTVEAFEIKPTRQATGDTRKELADALERHAREER